jgi:molecular chaperone GrpE
MTKKKTDELEQEIAELTADLQRVRADFENYRKRVGDDLARARTLGAETAVVKLLPIIDDIERSVAHLPADLAGNAWAQGVATLARNLGKMLDDIGLTRIDATAGTPFNPDRHHAVQFDEADGEHEIIAEELQPGYLYDGAVLRPAMVRVTRQ